MGKSIELSTKHPQLKKIAVDNKKIQGKNGGYLVNKLESYQHFVCG